LTDKKIIKRGWVLATLFSLTVYLGGCNDLPTEVGIQTDTLSLYALSSLDEPEIVLFSNNFTADFPVVYGSGAALLGNTDLTQSSVFLGFETPPDSLGYLSEPEILEPKLVLNFDRYAFGDSVSNFAFDVVRTMYELPEIAYWDWAYSDNQWPESPLYDLSSPLVSYSNMLDLADTVRIELPLPQSLIKEYLDITQANTDTASYSQGEYPFGMALVADENTDQFRRLYTSVGSFTDLNPKIQFDYQLNPDSIVTVLMDASITGQLIKPTEAEQGDIIIGSGVRRRSQLFFDLSSIPEDANVISSSLWLYSKPENNMFGNISPDSLLVVDSLRNPLDSLSTPNAYYGQLFDNGELYVPTLTAFMSGWDLTDGIDTITMLPLRPISRLDRLVFHSPATTDENKRPKLVVIYQSQPGI